MATKDRIQSIEETSSYAVGAAGSVDDFKYSSSGSLEQNIQIEFEEGRGDYISNGVITNGVNDHSTSTSLQVTGNTSDNYVSVAAGRAYVNGKRLLQTSSANTTITGSGASSNYDCYLELSGNTFTTKCDQTGYTGASNQLLLATGISVDGSGNLSGDVTASHDVRAQYSELGLADIVDGTEIGNTDWGVTSSRVTHTIKIDNSGTGTALVLTNTGAGYAGDFEKTKITILEVGGGYGSTGATISTDGNIQADGTLTVDGASTLTGTVTLGADLDCGTHAITNVGNIDGVDVGSHVHSGGTGGAQLDWDTCWADAVHDHSASGEGGAVPEASVTFGDAGHSHTSGVGAKKLTFSSCFTDATHDHSSAAEGDTIPEASLTLDDSTGHTHTGSGGEGSKVDHADLLTIGSATHASIDTHLGSTANPHTVTLDQAADEGSTTDQSITTGGYAMGSAVTRYWSGGLTGWLREDGTEALRYNSSNEAVQSASQSEAKGTMNVYLPHGAVVTELYIRGINGKVTLWRRKDDADSADDMATCQVTGGLGTAIDSTISYATIDNSLYQYVLTVELGWSDPDNDDLRSVQITYTITAPYP